MRRRRNGSSQKWGEERSKNQDPTSREAPNSKIQIPNKSQLPSSKVSALCETDRRLPWRWKNYENHLTGREFIEEQPLGVRLLASRWNLGSSGGNATKPGDR